MRTHVLVWVLFFILFAIGTAGCAAETPIPALPPPTPYGTFALDPVFEFLAKELGNLTGSVITPMVDGGGGVYYQYATNVIFVYEPDAAPQNQVRLYPSALHFKIDEPSQPDPQNNKVYINGHVVWDEVLPYYTRLTPLVTGLPLTEVRFNTTKKRYEQYFERVGFYRRENDPNGTIYLMPYGAWLCSAHCPQAESVIALDAIPAGGVTLSASGEVIARAEISILVIADRLGPELTGNPLSETYKTPEGKYEKIYENVVIVVDPQDIGNPYLLDLPQWVGIVPMPAVGDQPIENMIFMPTFGEMGFHIPQAFWEFITAHGTVAVSGSPITPLKALSSTASRQCFKHLCIEYHVNAPSGTDIRPSPLGREYHARYYVKNLPTATQPPQVEPAPAQAEQPAPSGLRMQVWEASPQLFPDQKQIISAMVVQGTDPVPGVSVTISLLLPDGQTSSYNLALTDANGRSSLTLESVPGAKGTLVPYTVCINGAALCINDSFLLWDD